jgi:hypothetical protein
MFEFYGRKPPGNISSIEVGGVCPHCKKGTKFIRTSDPLASTLQYNSIFNIVIDYACTLCRKSIPISWRVSGIDQKHINVENPKSVVPIREEFDFDYVPDKVRKEIEEALDCLSVNAYNGFAAVCRRSIQAISTELGANATTKVKQQIENMIEISGLGDEWKEIAEQIMLSGHDGAHPHLPEMNSERVAVLLSLLQDLTYQLFTRPGKAKRAAELRRQAIEKKSSDQNAG